MSATTIRALRAVRIRMGFESDLSEMRPADRKAIEKDRADGLGWKYDGLRDWTTEDVFRKLHELSIHADPAQFRAVAEQHGGVQGVVSAWSAGAQSTGPWADFPLLAAEELWYRLLPDIDCPEVASRRLDERVLAGDPDSIRIPSGEAERRELWRALTEFMAHVGHGNPETWPARYAEAQACSPIDYEDIVVKLLQHANGGELDAASQPILTFAQAKPGCMLPGYLGIAFARAGRADEAHRYVASNIARYPNDPWAHEQAGEAYLLLGQTDATIRCFRCALQMAETALDWGALLEHMCTAVETHAADPSTQQAVTRALDLLADEIRSPDD